VQAARQVLPALELQGGPEVRAEPLERVPAARAVARGDSTVERRVVQRVEAALATAGATLECRSTRAMAPAVPVEPERP
jgi:hypothetical protein